MPAIRDWTYSYNTNSPTATAYVPQYQQNDLIILAVSSNYANSNVFVNGFSNLFGRAIVGNSSLQHNSLHVLYKIAGASESDYTVNFGHGLSDGFTQSVNSSTIQCITVRDVNTTTPFNGTGQSAFTTGGQIATGPAPNGTLTVYPAGRSSWSLGGNVYLGDAVTGSGVTAGTVITGFGVTTATSMVNHNNGSTVITVTGAPTGYIAPGQTVRAQTTTDLLGNTIVVAQLTSTATNSALGGAGTYLLSQPSTSGVNRTGQTYTFWSTGGPGVYLVNNSQTVGGAPPSDVAITITHPTGVSTRINGNIHATGYSRANTAAGTQIGLLGSTGGDFATQGFRGQVAALTTTVNNSLVLFINSSAGLSVAQVLEGNCTFESANDGAVTSLGYSWTMKRSTSTAIGGPTDYIFYNQIVAGNTSPGIIATIGISPPSGGATIIPTYCVADNSNYIDPLQGTTGYNNNSVFSPTPNTTTNYFSNITLGGAGIVGAGGALPKVVVAAAADVGLHSFHSMANLSIAAPAAGFYQGMGMQLDYPNRFSLSAGTGFEAGKQFLMHIKPSAPKDYQSTDNITKTIVNGGRGVLIGLGSNVALMTAQIGAGTGEGIIAISTKSTSGNLTVGTIISGTGIPANTAIISTEPTTTAVIPITTGITTNGVTWTVTTTGAPVNWVAGQNVVIPVGIVPTAYAGSYTIATGGTNTFTITNGATPGAVTTQGAVRGVVSTTGNGLGWYKVNNSTAVAATPNILGITSKLYHLHGAGTKWNVAQHVPLIIHPNYVGISGANAIVQANASLDTTQISHIGAFASGFTSAINYHVGTAWAIGNVIISGGNAAEPVNLSGIQKAASQGKERQSILINGASQILCSQPLQFGDGGTNAIYLDLDSTSIQFPRQYNQGNAMVYYAGIDNAVGITYYAGSGDTIKHTNAIISSLNKFTWNFHPQSSASATYDFSGTTISGAGIITLNQNVDLTSVAFSACDQIAATTIPKLRTCVFTKTTASAAKEGAIAVTGSTMDSLQGQVNKLINCQYTNNTNSSGGALRLIYTGTAALCNVYIHNQYFASNSYDIYWDAPANSPLNLRYVDMAVFIGQISGTTLTVSLSKTGYLFPDMSLSGSGMTAGTTIVTQLSGTNGREGTYTVSVSQTVAAGSTIYASGTRMTNPPTTYQAALSNTVTFQNKKMFVISNIVDGSNVKIYDQATVTQLSGSGVNSIGAVPVGLGSDSAVAADPDNAGRYILSYEYSYSSDTPIYVVVIQTGYQAIRSTYTLTNMSSVLKVSQVIDRQYSNP